MRCHLAAVKLNGRSFIARAKNRAKNTVGLETALEPKPLGLSDAVFFALAMNIGLPWIAIAGAVGPSSLPLWSLALIAFFVPLAVASIELTSRFEGEGGIYTWVRETFGDFAGFMCGWIYWTANLPFFATTLYSIVTTLALATGASANVEELSPLPILLSSIAIAVAVLALQLAGLGVGKWLANAGGLAVLAVLAFLLAGGAWTAIQGKSATDLFRADYVPPATADTAILWATMVFAYCGAEGLAFLRSDIRDGTRTIRRAIVVLGVSITAVYNLGTLAILTILPADVLTRVAGLPQALHAGAERMGIATLVPLAMGVVALSMLGSYSAWFRVSAQLPFVAGIDHYLPAAFGRRNQRTGAPTWPLVLQAVVAIGLVVLSQAGATVQAAYDFLISMTVLPVALSYVFLFAVYLKLQTHRAGVSPRSILAIIGLLATLAAVGCSLVPSPHEPNKVAAIVKLIVGGCVLIASGAIIYAVARARINATKASD